jgi:hypothetical protein
VDRRACAMRDRDGYIGLGFPLYRYIVRGPYQPKMSHEAGNGLVKMGFIFYKLILRDEQFFTVSINPF